jgi:hypothetical protein
MMHGAPIVSWTPSTEAMKTTTTASSTTKDSTPPPIPKKGSAFCIKRASTGQVLLAVVKLKVEANGPRRSSHTHWSTKARSLV